MAIRGRDILKNWFKRGKYPLESQFADWIDSFVHRQEDSIEIKNVSGLSRLLNGKFDSQSGEALSTTLGSLKTAFDTYTKNADEQTTQLREKITNDERRLTTAESVLKLLSQATENIRTLRVDDLAAFELHPPVTLASGGFYQVIAKETGESEYWICVTGAREELPYPVWGEGSFRIPTFQIRIKPGNSIYPGGELPNVEQGDILYRMATLEHSEGHGNIIPNDEWFLYEWTSLKDGLDIDGLKGLKTSVDSKLPKNLKSLSADTAPAATDIVPIQHTSESSAKSVTLSVLKAFLNADHASFRNCEPDLATTELEGGVYAVNSGVGYTLDVWLVSLKDSPTGRPSGGSFTRVWTRTYYVAHISSSGFEYCKGTASMGSPSTEPFPIEWDEWTSLEETLDSKQEKFTTSEDLQLSETNELGLTERAKQRLFDDLWTAACGSFGKVDHTHVENGLPHPYKLDVLWLTYGEAVDVFDAGHYLHKAEQQYGNANIRINLPPAYGYNNNSLGAEKYHYFNGEVIILARGGFLTASINKFSICDCPNLRRIATVLRACSPTASLQAIYIPNCPKLEDISFAQLSVNVSISESPLLSLASLQYLVANAANTTAITVTVHPDVYAKLTGDTGNMAAATLTADELVQWAQVLANATAKNISFATV